MPGLQERQWRVGGDAQLTAFVGLLMTTALCAQHVPMRLPPVDAVTADSALWIARPGNEISVPGLTAAPPAGVTKAGHQSGVAAETIASPQGWSFGYDNGFVIAGSSGPKLDTDHSEFLLRVGSWGQLRQAYFDSNGPNPDLNQWEWERLRLVFDGHAFGSDFRYFFQYDADSDGAENAKLLDYFITYDVGHDLWDYEPRRLEVRLGKWKIPFARSRDESGTRLEFADRSMAGVFFDFNRSIGVGLLGTLDGCLAPVKWHVALTNGINTGGFQTGRAAGQLDRNFAVSGRFTSDLLGEFGNDGEPDLEYHLTPAWRVGTGFAYSRVNVLEAEPEFSVPRVVDSGVTINTILPADTTAYDFTMFAVDSHVKYHGASVITEYFIRYLSRFSGAAVPELLDQGLLLQTGYFVLPEKLELLARWSRIFGDSGTLGVSEQSADEVAFGVVWYFRGQDLKLTFDATHVNGAPINDSSLNILAGDIGWLYRTQFQFRF